MIKNYLYFYIILCKEHLHERKKGNFEIILKFYDFIIIMILWFLKTRSIPKACNNVHCKIWYAGFTFYTSASQV